jgi:hypothetical protein
MNDMDVNKTGGPAYPTLSGGHIDEKTFRWEGLSLFDYYAAAAISSGKTIKQAAKIAQEMLELRKEMLFDKAN